MVKLEENDILIGRLFALSTFACVTFSYCLFFRSGCVFDSKLGFGNLKLAANYQNWGAITDIVAIGTASLGAYFIFGRKLHLTVLAFLFILIFGSAALFWVNLQGEIHGAQTCIPAIHQAGLAKAHFDGPIVNNEG